MFNGICKNTGTALVRFYYTYGSSENCFFECAGVLGPGEGNLSNSTDPFRVWRLPEYPAGMYSL